MVTKAKSVRAFKFREGNENDLDSLYENYMWFADLPSLNDPYEGYASFSNEKIDDDFRQKFLTAVYAKQPKESVSPETEAKERRGNSEESTGLKFSDYVDSKAMEIFRSFYAEHRDDCKVLSLSLGKGENDYPAPLNNMLMWSHYANGFKGFCIEYDFGKLKSSMELENNIELASSTIEYATDGKLPIVNLREFMQSTIDDSRESSFEILRSFTRKEQSWGYENEVRFIAYQGGQISYSPSCINNIYISEKAPNWLKSNILSNVALKRADIGVYLVGLHPTEYKFGFKRIGIKPFN